MRWARYDAETAFEGIHRIVAYGTAEPHYNHVGVRAVNVSLGHAFGAEGYAYDGVVDDGATISPDDLCRIPVPSQVLDLHWTSPQSLLIADRAGGVTHATLSGNGVAPAPDAPLYSASDYTELASRISWSGLVSREATLTSFDVYQQNPSFFAVGDSAGIVRVVSTANLAAGKTVEEATHAHFANTVAYNSQANLMPLMMQAGLNMNMIRTLGLDMPQKPSQASTEGAPQPRSVTARAHSTQTGMPATKTKFSSAGASSAGSIPTTLFTSSLAGHVIAWDLRTMSSSRSDFTQSPICVLRDPEAASVTALATHKSKTHLVAAGYHDGRISVWDIRAPQAALSTIQAHSSAVTEISFTSLIATAAVLTASSDGTFCLFEYNRPSTAGSSTALVLPGDVGESSSEKFSIQGPRDVSVASLYAGAHPVVAFDTDVHSRHLIAASSGRELVHMPFPLIY